MALALHVAVAVTLAQTPAEPFGAGGVDLEAISVEVALVPTSAIESRAANATPPATSTGSIDQVDGASVASAAAPEVAPTDAKPETQAQPNVEEPPATLPQIALLEIKPDLTPPDPEAVQLPAAKPTPPPQDVALEPERPRPDRIEPTPEPSVQIPVAAAPPSTGSIAVDAGGLASRGTAGPDRPARSAATASPGAVNAFSKGVAEALGRTKPNGIKAGIKGTVRIAFAVADGGGLEFVRVANSSGAAALDDAALAAVKRASFPLPPPGLSTRQRTYEVPYHFR